MPITSIDASDVNKLTSGQVIIELQSVVKELIDNSLDAGSQLIEVVFNNYGIKGIDVTDTGRGIEKADFGALCLKHHTSKLSSFEELESVSTLGFRGEALASLCAVAKVKITTCTDSTYPKASQLDYDSMGRLTSEKTLVTGKKGTAVSVQDLFHGLPVRQKYFAKNAKREYSKALSLLVGYLLVYTNVRFAIYQISGNTGKKSMVMGTQGQGASIFDTLVSVYGSNGAHGLVPIDIATDNIEARFKLGMKSVPVALKFRINGLILDYSFGMGRGALDRQFLYVNKRPIIHKRFAKIINEVYKAFNHTQLAVFVLNIEIDQTFVDVNVTPDKRSVMVQNEDLLGEVLREEITKFYDSMHNVVPKSDLGVVRLGSSQSLDSFQKRKASNESASDLTGKRRQSSQVSKISLTEAFLSGGTEKDPQESNDKQRRDLETVMSESDGAEEEEEFTNISQNVSKMTPEESFEDLERMHIDDETEHGEDKDEEENEENEEEEQQDQEEERIVGEEEEDEEEVTESMGFEVEDPVDIERLEGETLDEQSENTNPSQDNIPIEPLSVQPNNDFGDESDIDQSDDAADNSFLLTEEAQLFVQQDETIDDGDTETANVTEVDDTLLKPHSHGHKGGHGCCHSSHDETFELDEGDQTLVAPIGSALGPADRQLTKPVSKSSAIEPVAGINRILKLADYDFENELIPAAYPIKTEKTQQDKATLVNVHDVREKLIIQKLDFPSMEVVGQFNLGFIVVRHDDRLFIVDQHASDEIFNYERLHRLLLLRAQPLVIPRVLELSPIDEMLVLDQQDQLRKNGFVIREAEEPQPGKRVELIALPVLKNVVFDDSDLHELVQRLHEAGPAQGSIVRCKKVDLMIALRACRLSIMVGQTLNRGTMSTVVGHLAELDRPWNCPHGRPTMRHLADLEGQGFTDDYKL